MEAIRLLRDADLRDSICCDCLQCLHSVQLHGELELRGLSVLLLRGLQHHWLRGPGEQPEAAVRISGGLPVWKLPFHLNGGLLHLLTFQRHFYRHQADSQLDPGKAGLLREASALFLLHPWLLVALLPLSPQQKSQTEASTASTGTL